MCCGSSQSVSLPSSSPPNTLIQAKGKLVAAINTECRQAQLQSEPEHYFHAENKGGGPLEKEMIQEVTVTKLRQFFCDMRVARLAKVVQEVPTRCLNGLQLRENAALISHHSPNE